MRGACGLAFVGLLASGCAARAPKGTVTSAAVADAIQRQKSGILEMKDVNGDPYTLYVSEAVRAPTPPDGQVRKTTVLELVGDCKIKRLSQPPLFVSPSHEPCWMNRSLQIVPAPEPSTEKSHLGSSLVTAGIVFGALAAVSAVIYCGTECPKPWNVVVPVGVPVALVVGFLVALSADLSRPGGFRFMNAPGPAVVRW